MRIPLVAGLFPNALHIGRREFFSRVRGRTFAILTGVLAVAALGLTLLPIGIRMIAGTRTVTIAVSVQASNLNPTSVSSTVRSVLQSVGGAGSSSDGTKYSVEPVADADAARDQVRGGTLDGLLTVTRSADGDLAFDYFSKDSTTSQRPALLRQAASSLAIDDRLQRAGVSAVDRGRIFAQTAFTQTPADQQSARRTATDSSTYLIGTTMVVLTLMAITVYGNWAAMSVAEEKNSRVMELLISAATPRQLLMGKVLGNGTAGLLQFGIVLVAALVGYLAEGQLAQRMFGETSAVDLPGLTPALLLAFFVFFVGGFFLYSILYAAAGSMVSRQEDVQTISGPLTFLGVGAYLLSIWALGNPDDTWVRILSWLPFTSSFMFPLRILLSSPAPWEYVLSLGLLVVGMLGSIAIAARIYAAGVLLYGQRPSMRAIWRAARASG